MSNERDALAEVRDVLAHAPIDCLGEGRTADGQTYPIRDEVIDRITKALAAQPAGAVGVQAWMANDGTGRVIDAKAKAAADRSGGATASAMAAYTIPLAPPAASVDVDDAMVKRAEDYFYDNSPFSGPDELREGLRGCLTAALSYFAGRAKDLPGMWEESDLIGGETDSREAGSAYANANPQPAEGEAASA